MITQYEVLEVVNLVYVQDVSVLLIQPAIHLLIHGQAAEEKGQGGKYISLNSDTPIDGPKPERMYNPSNKSWVSTRVSCHETCLKNFQRGLPKRYANQIPEPPQLTLVNTEEQQLYCELP